MTKDWIRTHTSDTKCKKCGAAAVPRRVFCRKHVGEEKVEHRNKASNRLDANWLSSGGEVVLSAPTMRLGELFRYIKASYDEFYPQPISTTRVKEWYDMRLVPQGMPPRLKGNAWHPILTLINPLWEARPLECPYCARRTKHRGPWSEAGLKNHISQGKCQPAAVRAKG